MNYIMPFPRVLRIETSALCNLKCIHCPTGTKNMKRGLMSQQTFSLVVENIKKHLDNVKVVVLYHGGEPFLNKDFTYMLKTIKSINSSIFIKITSNGMLLDEKNIEDIIKSELDMIYISIDGNSPEENNFIRKNSNYHLIVKNIKNLIEKKREFGVNKPEILITNVQIPEKIDENTDSITTHPPEFLLKEFEKEYERGELSFQSLYPLVWPDMLIDENILKIQEMENKGLNYCDSLINTMTIRWNGDVVPCCLDLTSKMVLGNIYEDSLDNIWNNEDYLHLRESINKKICVDLCKYCETVSEKKYLLLKA